MAFLYSIVLLVLAGSIHCSPAPTGFHFEVSLKLEVISVQFGSNAVINCKTNDPTAQVTLNVSHSGYPSNLPAQPGKITRNGSIFTVHNIIVYDGGKYICVAERRNGQKITRPILLTIDSKKPSIAIVPFMGRRVVAGSQLTYTCEGNLGSLAWYKVIKGSQDVKLPALSLPGVSITSSIGKLHERRSDLVISNADFIHDGEYRCQLTYRGRTLWKSVVVEVRGPMPPRVTSTSQYTNTVAKGQDLELDCQASGFPRPVVTWKKDNKEIKKCYAHQPCASSQPYVLTGRGLKIVSADPDDDAVYRCEASNKFGLDHRDFIVIVPTAPVIKRLNQPVTWRRGQKSSIIIPCELMQGSPMPTFKWLYRPCLELPTGSLCFDWTRWAGGAKNSRLEITPKETQMFTNLMEFKCTVDNAVGKDHMVVKLMREGGK